MSLTKYSDLDACLFRISLIFLLVIGEQGTIAERAIAFRQQCELAETIKLKEIDLYDFPIINFYFTRSNILHKL